MKEKTTSTVSLKHFIWKHNRNISKNYLAFWFLSEVRGQQREHTLTSETKISYNKNIRDGVFYKDANMNMSWTVSLKHFIWKHNRNISKNFMSFSLGFCQRSATWTYFDIWNKNKLQQKYSWWSFLQRREHEHDMNSVSEIFQKWKRVTTKNIFVFKFRFGVWRLESEHEREDDMDCVSKTFHLKTQPEYFQKFYVFKFRFLSEVGNRDHTLTSETKISYNKKYSWWSFLQRREHEHVMDSISKTFHLKTQPEHFQNFFVFQFRFLLEVSNVNILWHLKQK